MAKYDFMSFGEPNIRMTPPNHDRLGQSDTLQLGIAAAELNCCVNISNLSVERLMPQKKTAYVTKLVDNWTGKYIVEHARMYGVDMSNVVVEPFDKIGRTRNGLAFVEVGIGPRASYQIYDRGHTALSKIQPGDIDWESVLDTRWFHHQHCERHWASTRRRRFSRAQAASRTARPQAMVSTMHALW
ncbi:MAG: hypothetical protein ACLS3C_05795 [Oscillospiraceae bacterium]